MAISIGKNTEPEGQIQEEGRLENRPKRQEAAISPAFRPVSAVLLTKLPSAGLML
jgi:hypothetical protein